MSDTNPHSRPQNENNDKKDKNLKEDEHTLKQNPNPAANANVPEEDKKNKDAQEGVGTEITDGEGG